jgi:hypothetical protein
MTKEAVWVSTAELEVGLGTRRVPVVVSDSAPLFSPGAAHNKLESKGRNLQLAVGMTEDI